MPPRRAKSKSVTAEAREAISETPEKHVTDTGETPAKSLKRGKVANAPILSVGSKVYLRGLSYTELNGLAGTCQAWLEDRQRWQVLLPNGESKNFKPENLELEQAEVSKADPEVPGSKRAKKTDAPKRDKNTPLPRSLTPRQLEPDSDCRMLKLISVNVAGLRAVLRSDKAQALRQLVERELPDVLCLNEHKLKEEDVEECERQLKDLLPKEYAVAHWTCSTEKKGYSGVAMFLRQASKCGEAAHPIPEPGAVPVTKGMGAGQEGDPIVAREGRLLTLELPELFIVATYVPNSGTDLARLSYRTDWEKEQCWDRSLAKYVRSLEVEKHKPVVVIGDLNCCSLVQDIWNMHDRPDFPEGLAQKDVEDQYTGLTSLKKFAGLTPEERKSFPRLLADSGLVDTFRTFHPEASGVFSYFSQRIVQNRPMNRGLRLDYALASSSLCTHLKPKATIVEESEGSTSDLPLPRVHDSFILDEDDLIADHAAIGCHILLPPS